ncbi:hypothetical protein Pmani_023760 [Petrolisthes manimaculis]|uniref:Uncharacterized protein n=1 Tax=Petrolisthes manimaculis TaxID=1843537 RepID=A0AAE1PBD6_9EUCA|nr:hypothetical protein Pmani_023760 [Petrolisthes manimaculis]
MVVTPAFRLESPPNPAPGTGWGGKRHGKAKREGRKEAGGGDRLPPPATPPPHQEGATALSIPSLVPSPLQALPIPSPNHTKCGHAYAHKEEEEEKGMDLVSEERGTEGCGAGSRGGNSG